MAPLSNHNPYVGPRTFTTAEREKFFGREREARDLTALIVSNRLVLFYAPSGAGKSSLLNTMIRPALAGEGFEVLPTGRVSGYSGGAVAADNIYVYNLLLSLHQQEETPSHFEKLTLSTFLDNLVQGEGGRYRYDPAYVYPSDAEFKPRVLVIDQMEELLTTNAERWEQRSGFFQQLAGALVADDQLWVVLTMREDFVARLDPYLYLLPNGLRYRYYMERLMREAALEAIRRPAAGAGRPFVEEAAEWLVDNLRRIRRSGGDGEERLDQFVEPVQLQAVCYQMWEKLRERPGKKITVADVQRFADVDTALTNFYEETVAKTVAETGVAETDLRAWFDEELLTEAGTRNMVFRGEEMSGSLPTAVADHVRGQFILREVVRPGGTWFELVHDRFVAPIVAANQAWRQEQPLIRLAQEWDEAGRPDDLLLSGQRLEKLAEGEWRALGPLVAEFVQRGHARARARREERRRWELAQQRKVAVEAKARREAEAERAHEAEMRAAAEARRAEAEGLRAREAEVAAARLRRRRNLAFGLAGVALVLALSAFFFLGVTLRSIAAAQEEADKALAAQGTAALEASRAVVAESTAVGEATRAAENLAVAQTAEAEALSSANLAASRAAEAQAARLAAEAQATVAAENSAQAIAQAQARVADVAQLATAVSAADRVLATQEVLLAATGLDGTQLAAVQSVRGTLADTFSQNLKTGMNIDPAISDAVAQMVLTRAVSGLTLAPVAQVSPEQAARDVYADAAAQMAGLDWVRLPFRVDPEVDLAERGELERAVARYDPLVQAYALRGISVLFVLNQETFWGNAPWEGGNWQRYATQMAERANLLAGEMARRYAQYGTLIAYEIWNEPDARPENRAAIGVPPDTYAVILDQTAKAIRSVSPEAKIIFGSLSGSPETGIAYVGRVREALGGALPVDAIGLKPYGRYGTFDPIWSEQFGELGTVFEAYSSAYPELPLWVTEIGVASDVPLRDAENELIAAYMRDVYFSIGTRYTQEVAVVIWYAWSDEQRNAGVVDLNGDPKPAIYEAFEAVRDGSVYEGAGQ